MAACFICELSALEPVGALCASCASAIGGEGKRAPGIITARVPAGSAEAWLIDEWGQPHALGARSTLGRDRDRCDVAIAHLIVSSEHAELERARGRWTVRDRGSANGTRVGDSDRLRQAELEHRAKLWLGSIGFFFWAQANLPRREVAPPDVSTVIPGGAAFLLVAPRCGELRVRAASGHALDRAPGELDYRAPKGRRGGRQALGRLQFQLLRRLCEAAVSSAADGERSPSVGTQQLLRALPFQAPRPEPNHVRQVVANLRSALARAGVPGGGSAGDDGVVQAEEGLGYRLTWQVSRLETA